MPPVYVMMKPASGACNMRCKYCFYADVTDHREVKNYGKMSIDTLEAIVRRVFEIAETEAGFAFQGGEPTLAGLDFFEKLTELVSKYNEKNLHVSYALQTNGMLIDDKWAEFFTKNNFLIGLSLDGDKALHDGCRLDKKGDGTFSSVMKAAEIMTKHNTQFNILCVVTNFVARHGDKVYRFFKEKGFKYLQFIPCIDDFDMAEPTVYSLTPKRYGAFLKAVFDRYYEDYMKGDYVSVRLFDNYVGMLCGKAPEMCGMSGSCKANYIIEADGSVYPCDFYMIDPYRMGNVHTHSFSEMAESEAANRFVAESRFVDEDCKECEYGSICRGGCRRNREPITDGRLRKNVFCESYKEFFSYAGTRLVAIARDTMKR